MSGPGFIQGVPNFDKLEIVVIGYTSVSSDGSLQNWTTVPHNLGFKPVMIAFLNDVNLSGIADGVNVLLPTYGNGSIITGANNEVRFTTWIFCNANNSNAYFIMFNSTGSPVNSLPIKYYLLRERSS